MISQTGFSKSSVLIGMEATGHYWMLFFQHLTESGFNVILINPIVTHARRNIGIRGSKTDGIDALLIAQLLQETGLKKSAIAKDEVIELRDLTRLRFACSQEVVAEKNRLHSLLDITFPEYKDQFGDLFGKASMEVMHDFSTASDLADVNPRDSRRLGSDYFSRSFAVFPSGSQGWRISTGCCSGFRSASE